MAHAVRNKVEAAYARSDLFERRRVLMEQWAEYLARRGASTETSPDPSTGLESRFPDAAGAFRVFYGPQDRPRSTISGPRGVWVGSKIGARQRVFQSPSPSARLAAKRPWSLDATGR